MQRQKVHSTASPSYPTRERFPQRRAGLACVGMLLIMVGAPGCPGDVAVPIDGDIAIPAETFFVALPMDGSRTLYFDQGGWVDFHFEIVVDNLDLAEFLRTRAEGLLDRLEESMADQPPRAFDEIESIQQLEQRARQLLADEWTGTAHAPTYNFVECTLVVDELVDAPEIDGDMP
jgi:hypothetical protein